MSWTPKPTHAETWTSRSELRPFSPNGFSRTPAFSTGSQAGAWTRKLVEPETWTEK